MKLRSSSTLSLRAVTPIALAALLWSAPTAGAQSLGAAATSAVQASAGVTAAGGAGTTVNGEVGSSPSASITGFPPAVVVPPYTLHLNDGFAVAAQASVDALFVSLGSGACSSTPATQMNGATFTPGIHCFGAGTPADLSTGGTVTLNGSGTYIFRVGSALTANTGSNIILTGGANACNVFWQVGSSATLNGVTFPGNVVSQASVTLGVSSSLTGRALARTGSVSLSGNNTVGGCSAAAPPPVCPTITLSPTTLPNGTVAIAYNQTISASGGVAPNSFTVTSGTLPGGLTLTSGGVLAGTPTASGTFTFNVRGTDANGCFGNQSYTIVIAPAITPPPGCPTITLAPASLPNGTVAIAYNQAITGSGGTAPYSFGIPVGSAPAGLTLTPAGLLAGTPTTAGSSNFTVRGTDVNGCFADKAYTLLIVAAPAPPPGCPTITLTPSSLPAGAIGTAYSQTLSGGGGTAPYSFGLTAGALPAGLTLSPTGTLSGTPSVAGASSFTIRSTDANGCFREGSYTINIPGIPPVPTLSEWALIALIAMLALAGYLSLREQASPRIH